jgi:hypothetical protein
METDSGCILTPLVLSQIALEKWGLALWGSVKSVTCICCCSCHSCCSVVVLSASLLSSLAQLVYARMLAHQPREAADCAAETPPRQLRRQLSFTSTRHMRSEQMCCEASVYAAA